MDVIPNILALARAGATSRAWDAFVAAGLEGVTSDAKVLTLKGRLLKDRARAARNGSQARLYLASARAYADASTLNPDSYPLINAATMSLFAGQTDHMRMLANEVLAIIQTGVGRGETPYWHAATRAEALLLTGDVGAARVSLAEAIAHAPCAWEDHATTLRQFRQVLAFSQGDDVWLSDFAPPPSLYFSGMIGLAADDRAARDAIGKAVSDIGAGFGFGALAAGADILIAEALLAQGAELHIILPVIPSVFKSVSVEPFGPDWGGRFDSLFEQAATVEIIDGGPELSLAAIEIAAQVAKGRAVDNAARMESVATGLAVNATGNIAEADAGSQTLELEPSAPIKTSTPLASAESSLLAAFGPNASEVISYPDLATAEVELAKLRRHQPDTTIAVSLGVDTGTPEPRQAQVSRMVNAAARGTTIANAEAAMALKARNPKMWVEPLGELPEAGGAVSLYAIALN